MVTKRKTDMQKARGALRRALVQLERSLPATLRLHWRDVLMPWRLLSQPVALALIGLVALAMVCYPPEETGATPEPTSTVARSTIGGTFIPGGLACEEDQAIAFVGIPDTLVCVHVDSFAESDVFGCTPPAFYTGVDALGKRCSLKGVPPAPTSTVSPVVGAMQSAPITAPSVGAPSR